LNEVDEKYIVQLRDCFNAGYQMPQYCLDNNIKKPLFVGVDESWQNFLWEIYAQFNFAKRTNIQPKFILLNAQKDILLRQVIMAWDQPHLRITPVEQSKLAEQDTDKIILLTCNKLEQKLDNAIYLNDLARYFAVIC